MRLTAEQKREIAHTLVEIHDKLYEIKEKTGLSIDVAAYGTDKIYSCIFIHTKRGIVHISERSEIEGIFKSEKWRNRARKNGRGAKE